MTGAFFVLYRDPRQDRPFAAAASVDDYDEAERRSGELERRGFESTIAHEGCLSSAKLREYGQQVAAGRSP